MKRVLFVAYGSGHIKMLIPVAQALQTSGAAKPVVLALTTAAPLARAAGLEVVQFKDFLEPGDMAALSRGRQLVEDLGSAVCDPEESAAYLGLSYADLEFDLGAAAAEAEYRRRGRQAFLPVRTLIRILQALQPDLVVATSAPRAERAAIVAAGRLGLPSLCVVDLFAIDEVQWVGQAGYANRVCVLNAAVRDFLIAAGRCPEEVVVTGNPGLDGLNAPDAIAAGHRWRQQCGWVGRRVLLWPTQVEPIVHPFDGRAGDPSLPDRALQRLVQWTLGNDDAVLCVRPRAGEPPPDVPTHERIVITGQEQALSVLLHACDLVVTLTSTVGLEGHLAGCRVVQVSGSIFEDAMPLLRYGIADAAVSVQDLPAALDRWATAPRRKAQNLTPATQRVLAQIITLLQ
jgi:hypothetical protein